MVSPVSSLALRLRQAHRRLQGVALLGGLGGMALFAPALRATDGRPAETLLVLLLAAYLWRKAHAFVRSGAAARTLGLEVRFLQLDPDAGQLDRCLFDLDHLWQESLVLQTLRRLRARPLPRLLGPEARARRIGRSYRRTFIGLRPSRLNVDLLLCAPAFAFPSLLLPALAAPGPWGLAARVAATVLLTAELLHTLWLWRAREAFRHFEEGATAWTLARSLDDALHPEASGPYAHTLLYAARPWFSAPPRPLPPGPDHGAEAGPNDGGTAPSGAAPQSSNTYL